jgi:predicted nucleic acid-binding protein
VKAKWERHISAGRPLLQALREDAGFWISEALHDRVLDAVGE